MEEIKHITFERSGGFANIRFAADFELDELPDDQAHQLKELFDDLDFEELPENLIKDSSVADGFTYTITVESKRSKYTVTADDASAPEKMNPLFDLLTQIARQRMRKQ